MYEFQDDIIFIEFVAAITRRESISRLFFRPPGNFHGVIIFSFLGFRENPSRNAFQPSTKLVTGLPLPGKRVNARESIWLSSCYLQGEQADGLRRAKARSQRTETRKKTHGVVNYRKSGGDTRILEPSRN